MDTKTDILESGHGYGSVKEYYGQVVQKSSDLKTDACCSIESLGTHVAEVLPMIEAEIKDLWLRFPYSIMLKEPEGS